MARATLAALSVICAGASAHAQTPTPAEAQAIAKDAYIYGFPLVDSYRIQYSYFVDRSGPEYKAPWNQIYNNARVYTPADKAIQTPNSDTPYSYVGADLRAEPLVLTMPPVEKRRYYSVQLIDMYTFNFAYIGSRTTGNAAGSFLLAGPNWKGQKPKGIKKVIRSETEFVFVLYRTQLFEPDDIDNVKKIQAGYKVQTLSKFMGKSPPPPAPEIDFMKPVSAEEERSSLEFFRVLNFVLRFCPIHPSEKELMARFARLGIGGDGNFDPQALSPEVRTAVEEGMTDAWRTLDEFKGKWLDTGKVESGDSFGTREYLKNNYLYRMSAAVLGIYGNSKEEAMYPVYFVDSTGQKLDASHNRYALRFPRGQLPPVNAFWSLTIYELPSSLLVENPLKRYLINSSMLPQLKRDTDGGITLYIQHESPGKDKESNWLPAPNGAFFAVLRLYWPKPVALHGKWRNPPLQRADALLSAQSTTGNAVLVSADNFNRAESDMHFGVVVKEGGLGKFQHHRKPMSINKQTMVRANRDMLYSSAVFDLDAGPVTITLPDAGKRFMSMLVVDEDQYAPVAVYAPGTFIFTREQIGTRYVLMGIRTFVDPDNSNDVEQVHALQDAIEVSQASSGRFEIPTWDQASQKRVRDALIALSKTLPDSKRMFGPRSDVDPVRHLIGSATGWGGNPEKDATYLTIVPSKNDGKTIYRLSVKDVPVDGFWSISVYNAAGYFEKNRYDAYTLNSITAKKNADGSVDLQFGGCDGKIANCLPITRGWNYFVRLYRPRAEILTEQWKFQQAQPVN